MVVAIAAVMAAIAVPRLTGATHRAAAHSIKANVSAVRKAIDRYYAEHGRFPGYDPATGLPDGDAFVKQLTSFTDRRGRISDARTATYMYGPYIRPPFPANAANGLSTVHVRKYFTDAGPPDGSVGWAVVLQSGEFGISADNTELDRVGIKRIEEVRAVKLD